MLTYLGTIDDSAHRYPWAFPMSAGFFDETLIRAAIVGHPLAINDGYLFNLPSARAAIRNPASPLRILSRYGFIKILARHPEDILNMPKRMEEEGVEQFGITRQSDDYEPFVKELSIYVEELHELHCILPWPKYDISAGFIGMLNRIRDRSPAHLGLQYVSPEQLKRTFAKFDAEVSSDHRAPRTKWETAAKKVANETPSSQGDPEKILLDLMRLANEAYHFNFTACLGKNYHHRVLVETRFSPAFADMYETKNSPITHSLYKLPVLQLPEGKPLGHERLLAELVQEGSPLNACKKHYMTMIDRYIHGTVDYDSAHEATKSYSTLLSKQLGLLPNTTKYEEAVRIVSSNTITALFAAASNNLLLAAAVGLLIFYVEQFTVPMVFDIFKVKDAAILREARNQDVEDRMDRFGPEHSVISLVLDPDRIDQHTQSIPTF